MRWRIPNTSYQVSFTEIVSMMGSHRVLQWQHRFLEKTSRCQSKQQQKEKQDSTWCSKPFNLSAKLMIGNAWGNPTHNITQPNVAKWSCHSFEFHEKTSSPPFLVHFCAGNLAPNLGVSTHGHAGKPKPDQFGMAMPGYLEDHPSSKPCLLTGMILAVEILGLGDSFLDGGKRGRKQISHKWSSTNRYPFSTG